MGNRTGISRRRFVKTVGTLAGGLALAAPISRATAQPAGIRRMVVFWPETNAPAAQKGWDDITAAFVAANPGIEIKRVFQADMHNIIKVALASDSGPDVFQRDIPPSYHQPLVDAGLVRALDDAYASRPNLQKVFPWAKKRGVIKGKAWGVPHEVEFIPVFFNKTVMGKLGIKEIAPKSYDDFLALCKTIKAAGVQPLGLGGRNRVQPGHLFSEMVMLTLGKEGFEGILYGSGRWDQPGIIEAADRVKQLMDLGYLAKDALAQDLAAAQAGFAAGRFAMWTTGTWQLIGLERSRKDNPNFDYDYFFLPPINTALKAPQIAGGIGGGFSIAARAKDAEAAAIWIDFLMSPPAQKVWNEVFFQAAPTPFDPAKANLPPVPQKALALIARGQEFGYNVSVVIPSNVVEVYWNGLQGILSGQLTPKEWAGKLQVEWEQAKAEGKVVQP